jgi:hypothetical protein
LIIWLTGLAVIVIVIALVIYLLRYNRKQDFDMTPRDRNGNPLPQQSDNPNGQDYDGQDEQDNPLTQPINDPDLVYDQWSSFESFMKEIGLINIHNGMLEFETGDNSRLFVSVAEMQQSNPFLKSDAEVHQDQVMMEVWLNTLMNPVKISSLSQRVDLTDYLNRLSKHMDVLKGLTPQMKEYGKHIIESTLDYQKQNDRFENHTYVQFMCTVQPDEVYGDTPAKLEEAVQKKAYEKNYRQIANADSLLRRADHSLSELQEYGLLELLYKTFNRESSVKVSFEDIVKSQRFSLFVSALKTDQDFKEVQQRIKVETEATETVASSLWKQQQKENQEKIKKGEDYYRSPVDRENQDGQVKI